MVSEPESIEIDNYDWQNLYPNFTSELIQNWQNHNFTPQQTQVWLSIGFQPTDYDLATWLRDIIKLTPEQVLNEENEKELRRLFEEYKEQEQIIQIEQLPKITN